MRIDGIGNWVLMIMAAASLIIMIAAFSLQSIVGNGLSAYGLQFSYDWAIPYWNVMGIVFAMAWLNIIAAIAFQVYRIITIRREERQSDDEQFGYMPGSEYEQAFDEENMENYGFTVVAEQVEWQETSG
jgi:membrane-bound ClpP family serine protease